MECKPGYILLLKKIIIKKNQQKEKNPNTAQPGKQRQEHKLQDAWSHLSTAVNSSRGPSWQHRGDAPPEICRAIEFLEKAQVRPRCTPGEQGKSLHRRALPFHTARLAGGRTTEVAKRTRLGLASPVLPHDWCGGPLAAPAVKSQGSTWSYRCQPTQDSHHGSGNKAVCLGWHAPAGHHSSCDTKKKEPWKAGPWALS